MSSASQILNNVVSVIGRPASICCQWRAEKANKIAAPQPRLESSSPRSSGTGGTADPNCRSDPTEKVQELVEWLVREVVGTLVTITGNSLTQTTKVTFGGVKATSFTVISNIKVTANVPTGAKTGKIGITTPGGTATSSEIFTVLQ